MKHLVIVHGWGGHPGEGWFPWLKTQVKELGLTVHVPALPQTDEPRIENWVPTLTNLINSLEGEIYLVGHSMGCQTITRSVSTVNDPKQIKGIIYVAGFFTELTGLDEWADDPIEDARVASVANEWLTTPINFTPASLINSVAIFSDNDPYVPLNNVEVFKNTLHSKTLTVSSIGHFSGSSGITELSVVLEELKNLLQNHSYEAK